MAAPDNDDARPHDEQPTWYLRVSKRVYGPLTLGVLSQWAVEGRIGQGNEVSQDKETWKPLQALPELELNWSAKSGDGRKFGPFNLLALPNLIQWGVVHQDATLENLKTGQTFPLSSVLKAGALAPGRPPRLLTEQIQEFLTTQS